MSATSRPVEERLVELLDHLGIAQTHIAGRAAADVAGLAASYSDRIASMSLVCPFTFDPAALRVLGSRLLVITGDGGPNGELIRRLLNDLPGSSWVPLRDYESFLWSDVIADRAADVGTALLGFLDGAGRNPPVPAMSLPEEEGEVGGISYLIRGAGPPLLLLPLDLAPSQWEPLISTLSTRYCTITAGGAALGFVAALETRARLGYLGVIRSVLDAVQIEPGESIVEVGCGSGVVVRELARRSRGANRLLGLDINAYLRGEAGNLAKQEGLDRWITFQEGNAEALPLAANSVDVALSCTVLEEGNADRMLGELVRVTKPGGRIGVIVRATDMPPWVNVSLPPALKAKVDRPGIGGGVSAGGCADASLYQRFRTAGLSQLHFFPQIMALTPEYPIFAVLLQQIAARLSSEEATEWRQAVARAELEGTFFIGFPAHCAVGTKAL
jgi:SAM-dependent methyltransferase